VGRQPVWPLACAFAREAAGEGAVSNNRDPSVHHRLIRLSGLSGLREALGRALGSSWQGSEQQRVGDLVGLAQGRLVLDRRPAEGGEGHGRVGPIPVVATM